MAGKITKIVKLDPAENHPVVMENFSTYLAHRQHDMKGFLVQDKSASAGKAGVANMLMVTGEKQLYFGRFGGHVPQTVVQPQPDHLRTFVARRNRETGKMRLVEVRSCPLLHVSHDQSKQLNEPADPPVDERWKARMRQKFSSKASCKVQNRMQTHRLDLSMMEDKLKRTLTETVVKNVDAEKDEPDGSSVGDDVVKEVQSKMNPTAKSLRELFQAEKLIGATEYQALLEPAKKLLNVEPEQLLMANVYLENKVKAVMQSRNPSAPENLVAVRICIYMDVLARLLGPKAYTIIKGRESISPFTKVLDDPIRAAYLQRVMGHTVASCRVTKYTRNKALLNYLALLFVLEGSDELSANAVHRSINMPKRDLLMFARTIGVRYIAAKDRLVVTHQKRAPKPELDEIAFLSKRPKAR